MGMNRGQPFSALRRFILPRNRPAGFEVCDFCSAPLFPQHRHLLEAAHRKIICVCDACALRFQDVVGGRFKLIPREARALPHFKLTDAQWEDLALPINLVFIFVDGQTGNPVAAYPGPAGVTESLLPLESWHTIVADNSGLEEMKPDVEALLINRMAAAREYYMAPMDVCFELAGLLRKQWRGFSGGEMVWSETETFFSRLREQAGQTEYADQTGLAEEACA